MEIWPLRPPLRARHVSKAWNAASLTKSAAQCTTSLVKNEFWPMLTATHRNNISAQPENISSLACETLTVS
jgi:hypothetical protein